MTIAPYHSFASTAPARSQLRRERREEKVEKKKKKIGGILRCYCGCRNFNLLSFELAFSRKPNTVVGFWKKNVQQHRIHLSLELKQVFTPYLWVAFDKDILLGLFAIAS